MTTSKSKAKEKVRKLIERYEQVKTSRQRPTYDEANTRKDQIFHICSRSKRDGDKNVVLCESICR